MSGPRELAQYYVGFRVSKKVKSVENFCQKVSWMQKLIKKEKEKMRVKSVRIK